MCFKGLDIYNLSILWRSNKKALMNSEIFQEGLNIITDDFKK